MNNVLSILIWLLPVAFCMHVIEEFFFPAGFMEWYSKYRPQFSYRTRKSYLIENAVFIALLFYGSAQQDPFIFLMMGSFLSFNVIITHIRGAIATRSYSPGIITGIGLQLTITIAGYIIIIMNGYLNIWMILLSLAMGPILEAVFALRPGKK